MLFCGKAALPQGVGAPSLRMRWDWGKSDGMGWDGIGTGWVGLGSEEGWDGWSKVGERWCGMEWDGVERNEMEWE